MGWLPILSGEAGCGEGLEGALRLRGKDSSAARDLTRREGNAAEVLERNGQRILAGDAIRLSACFGIANSLGRSPVVVLREAEQALLVAKATGPESIQCAGDFPEPCAAPVAFLSPTSGDELLAW